MKKNEFIRELKYRLSGYPRDVVVNAVNYYTECIEDAVEDGRDEEEAVAALGSMDEIVRNTLRDVPLTKLVKERVSPKRKLTGFEVIILILGFPIWFPLLIAAWAIFFAFYVVIWSLVFTIAVTSIALIAAGIVAFIGSIGTIYTGAFGPAVFGMGSGLICFAVGLFMVLAVPGLAKGALAIGRGFLLGVKKLFIGNGGNN